MRSSSHALALAFAVALSVAALASASSGCGGDDDGGSSAATVPAAIDVSVAPARLFYVRGEMVLVSAAVTSATGAPLVRDDIEWTIEPSSAVTAPPLPGATAMLVLSTEGVVSVKGCLASAPELCDSVRLNVDDGSPVLELETPTPGAELDDPAGIVVRGSVADASGVLDVFVGGVAVDVDMLGRFETTLLPRFGAEHIEVVASDARTAVARVEMDVLWAPAFTAARDSGGQPRVDLADGVTLALGQRLFDDGAPLDTTAMPLETRDLADLVELVVAHADVSGLVPDPVVDSPPTFVLRLPSVMLGAPHAELAVRDDGIDLFLRVGGLVATTAGQLVVSTETLDLAGTLTGSVSAYARLTVHKDSPDEEVRVELVEIDVAIESVDGTFVDPDAGAVFRLAAGVLRTTLEAQLRDVLRDLVETSIPPLLTGVLSGIDHGLEGVVVPIDRPPLPAIELHVDGRMSRIEPRYRDVLLAPLGLALSAPVASAHGESRGVARGAIDPDAPPALALADAAGQIGVKLGVLNGLLHVLWDAGMLDLDLTPLLPASVAGIVSDPRLTPRLPPIVRPARTGEGAQDLVLSVAQLELAVALGDGARATFGVRIDAGVDVTLTASTISIDLAEEPSVLVWPIDVPEDSILTPELVEDVLAMLWPDLRASIAESLSIAVPIPPLSAVATIAPDLAGLSLSLDETDPRLFPRATGELLVLDVALTGRVP